MWKGDSYGNRRTGFNSQPSQEGARIQESSLFHKSFEKQKERELRKALKNVKIAATKALKVKINDKKNKRKTTKGGALKKVVDPIKNYQKALKKHDWEDNNASFYRWVAIEANGCSSNNEFFKDFKVKNFFYTPSKSVHFGF